MHTCHKLRDLAANHVRFVFGAAVVLAPAASAGAGGAPIFSLFREALPAPRIERFHGILNSTNNLILTEMEHGSRFEAAVKKAQDRSQLGCGGIAETDPSFDVEGWDATVKVSALASAHIHRLPSVAPLRQAWSATHLVRGNAKSIGRAIQC